MPLRAAWPACLRSGCMQHRAGRRARERSRAGGRAHVPERATRRCTRAWYSAACLSAPAPRVGGRNWSSSSVDVLAMGSFCHTAMRCPALSLSLPASRSHTCTHACVLLVRQDEALRHGTSQGLAQTPWRFGSLYRSM